MSVVAQLKYNYYVIIILWYHHHGHFFVVVRCFLLTSIRMGTPSKLNSCRIAFIKNFCVRSEIDAAVVNTAKVGGLAFTWMMPAIDISVPSRRAEHCLQ